MNIYEKPLPDFVEYAEGITKAIRHLESKGKHAPWCVIVKPGALGVVQRAIRLVPAPFVQLVIDPRGELDIAIGPADER